MEEIHSFTHDHAIHSKQHLMSKQRAEVGNLNTPEGDVFTVSRVHVPAAASQEPPRLLQTPRQSACWQVLPDEALLLVLVACVPWLIESALVMVRLAEVLADTEAEDCALPDDELAVWEEEHLRVTCICAGQT